MTGDAPCCIVAAADVAEPFLTEINERVAQLGGRTVKLVGFLANDDPAAKMYASWTAKRCADSGIAFELVKVPKTELEDAIVAANDDASVHGIIVYYPVFGTGQDQYLQNTVSAQKDVEGLCHLFRYNLYHNIRRLSPTRSGAPGPKCILPCTPLALVKVLEHVGVYSRDLPFGDRLAGRVIAVINRSEVVGRPLAALLANDGARVYSIDVTGVQVYSRGDSLHLPRYRIDELERDGRPATAADVLPECDVVISGVPSKAFKVPTEQLRRGIVAVNFATHCNFEDSVTDRASVYVSSVGKVTVAMLQRNLIRLQSAMSE